MANTPSVETMWKAYLETIGEQPETTDKLCIVGHFCDNQADANLLAELVKIGQKRATAGSLWAYEQAKSRLPEVGDHSVITNWDGEAQCVIRTVAVEIVPFNEVTADFAHREGEGDRSLAYWRKEHWAYFIRELGVFGKQPDETMPIVCEKFELVYPLSSSSV